MNYYNEFDPQAAQWLRNLISADFSATTTAAVTPPWRFSSSATARNASESRITGREIRTGWGKAA